MIRRARELSLAGLTLAIVLPGAMAGQEEEDEAARILRICEQLGNSELELGIEGVVRDKDSDVPLPGATVVIRYESERDLATPEDVTVEADDEGRYQACGLEAFREVRIRAGYRLHRGDERKIELDRPKFVDLEIDVGAAAFLVFSIVAAEDGRPVQGARLSFEPLPLSGVTDSLGRVAFRAIPPGTYDLRVEHIAFAPRAEEINVLNDQSAEMRVELITQAIAVAPLEVTITGRDAYLLTSGFYERREMVDEGYFATYSEIESYTDLGRLFQFKRELSIRYQRNRLILINGRLASRLGYNSRNLREINLERVKGIEAYRCSEAPPEIMNQVPNTMAFGDCNLIAIWTR